METCNYSTDVTIGKMIIGGVYIMASENKNLRNDLRAQIMELTDRQAEYVLSKLSQLSNDVYDCRQIVSDR